MEKGASIPQKEHNWGEWTVKKAPTSEKTGTEIRYCQNEGCKASETREIAKLSTEVKVQSGRSLSWKYFYGETPAAKDIVLTSAGTNNIGAITELPDSIFRFILEIDETDPMVIHVKPKTSLWADTFNEELWQVKVRYEDGTEGWWAPADGSAVSTLKAEVVPALETYSVKVTGGTACNPSDKTNPITEAHPGEQVYVVADSDKIPECKEFDYWVEKHGTELDDSEDLQEEEALFTMPAADVELEAALKLVSHIGPEELKDAKDATCTKDGYTGNTVCAECGDVLKIGTAIPFKGHSFGPWIHTGSHTHTCTVCKYSETEECTFGDWVVTKQPTAAEKGEKEHTCSKCGYVEKAVIPATGTTANPDSNSPKTGDSRHTALWIILMLSAAVCAFGGIRKRKTTGK